MDRFEQGLPDPQGTEPVMIDECANRECGKEIFEGEEAVQIGYDLCCSWKCAAVMMGAITLTAGEEN